MKGLILASLATCVSFVLATATFRLWLIQRRAYALLWVFAIGLGLIIVISISTPDDLMLLPDNLLATPPWFDLASSMFFFVAAFFGGILQIYNLADRGFSLRILIDLLEHPEWRGTTASLFDGYSSGKGIQWMYQKRIDDMTRSGLIRVDDDVVALTDCGAQMASVVRFLRRLLRIEAR